MPTKQEKAFERLKVFREELREYREGFARVRNLNEEMVCSFPFLFASSHAAHVQCLPISLCPQNHANEYNSD